MRGGRVAAVTGESMTAVSLSVGGGSCSGRDAPRAASAPVAEPGRTCSPSGSGRRRPRGRRPGWRAPCARPCRPLQRCRGSPEGEDHPVSHNRRAGPEGEEKQQRQRGICPSPPSLAKISSREGTETQGWTRPVVWSGFGTSRRVG